MLGDNDDGFNMYAQNIFPTKEAAIKDMKIVIRTSCDFF